MVEDHSNRSYRFICGVILAILPFMAHAELPPFQLAGVQARNSQRSNTISTEMSSSSIDRERPAQSSSPSQVGATQIVAQPVAVGSKPSIDPDGTLHIPSFDVPLSSYMSEEARMAFIKRTQALASLEWDENLPISELRARMEMWSQRQLQRVKTVYEVAIKEQTIAGVRTDVVMPKNGVAGQNQRRVLINLHGGGFFMGAGPGALMESIPVAAVGKIHVISVDYRLSPEYRFPAASEDVAAVYKELLKHYPSENIGIYGCSAGGILTAMSLAWFQREKLAMPGAAGIFGAGAFGDWEGDPRAAGAEIAATHHRH